MNRVFYINATNVHSGGGRSLLQALLLSIPSDRRVIVLLDTRMPLPLGLPSNLECRRVRPKIISRLSAEWWLARNVTIDDSVFCFGNLPPFFPLLGNAIVFVQNRYLIDSVSLRQFPFGTRLRLLVERCWLKFRILNVSAFVVQTPSMHILMERLVGKDKAVYVLPFVNDHQGYSRSRGRFESGLNADFIYPASGDPHKNHRRLIDAWCRLACEGCFPSLWLTLDEQCNFELCRWIDQEKSRYGLKIENLGVQPQDKMAPLYLQVRALIYPSTFESFGLPLIEARQAGIAVVASELDYVRDVVDPEQTFDPGSAVSIARSVKRFLGVEEQALPLLDAAGFIKHILERTE